MAMRTLAILTLLAVSAATSACSNAEFSPKERQDSSTTPDGVGPTDLPPVALLCEPSGEAVCTPSACGSVCHAPDSTGAAESACTVFSGTDSRYDDCFTGNVCLTDGFGASTCFALCHTYVDCPGGRACTPRLLAGATSVRVCDPPYQNCSSASEPCCNPLVSDSCGPGRFCYLLPPQIGSDDSWTVCDYLTGGNVHGEPCTASRDCLQGLACYIPTAPSGTVGECRQVCNPADANACATGTCTPYLNQWGVCLD